jgi:hypothetical protein
METSEQIDQIATALAVAQGAILNPTKGSLNPHFGSRYADLASGIDAIRSDLAANGIAFVQSTYMVDDMMMLETRLIHKSGQWMAADYPVAKFPAKHQDIGSALTYSRRYSLFGMVGIAGDSDDDGNAANKTDTPAPRRIAPKNTPPDASRSSEAMLEMLSALDQCDVMDDVKAWASQNDNAIGSLIEAHQARVVDALNAKKAAIKKAAAS